MENEMDPDGKNTLKYDNEDILESKLKRRSIRLQNLQNSEVPESSPKLPSTNDLKHNNSNGLELYNKEYDENTALSSGSDNIEQSRESLKSPDQLLPLRINKNANDRKYFKSNKNANANSSADDTQTENVSKAYKIISKPTPANQSSDLISAVPSKFPLKTYINPRRLAEKKQRIESFALPDNPLTCPIADITLPEIDKVLDTETLDAREITIQELQFVDEPWCIIDLETHFSSINDIRIKVEPQKHLNLRSPTKCNVPKESTPQTEVNKPVRRVLDVEKESNEKQIKKLPSGKGKNERIIANHSLTLEEHEVEIFNYCTVQNVSDSTSIKTNRLSRHSQNEDPKICEKSNLRSSNSCKEEISKKQSLENSRNKNSEYSSDLEKTAVDFDVPTKNLSSNSCADLDNDLKKCSESEKLKKSNSQSGTIEVDFDVPTRTLRSNSCTDLDDFEKCSKPEKLKKSSIQLGIIEVDFDIPARTLRSNSCTDLDDFEKCSKPEKLKKSNSQLGLVQVDFDIPARTLRSNSCTDLDDFEKSSKPEKLKKSNKQSEDIEVPKIILKSNSCTDLSEFDKYRKPEKIKKSNSQIKLDDNVNKNVNKRIDKIMKLVSDECSKIDDNVKLIDKINSVAVEKRKPKGNSKQLKVTLYQLPVKSKPNQQTDISSSAKTQISNKKPINLPDQNKNIASCGMILELVDIQKVYTDDHDSRLESTCELSRDTLILDDTSKTDVTEDETSILYDNFSFKRKSKSAANAKLTEYFQKPHLPKATHTIDFSPIGKQLSENVVMKLFEVNDISSPNSTSTPNNKSRDRSRKISKLDSDLDKSIGDRTEEDADKQQNCTKEKNIDNRIGESNKRKRGRPRKINKENSVLNVEATDLPISADSSIEDQKDNLAKHVNKENKTKSENDTSTSIVKENNRLLRSRPTKLKQSKNEIKAAEIDLVELSDNKGQKSISIKATNEDNKKLQSTQTEKNRNASKTGDRSFKTLETSKKQSVKDSVNDIDVDPIKNGEKTLLEFKTNSQNVKNLLDSTKKDTVLKQNRPPLNKTKRLSKINGQMTHLISETSKLTDTVETNSIQVSENLNSNKDISQKRTRIKTNIGDRNNDDVYRKSTRIKTSLEEPMNESNFEISTPTKIVEINSMQLSKDLNTNKDISQKRARRKTNVEDIINDDVRQKKTRTKTNLEEPVNDSNLKNALLSEISTPTKLVGMNSLRASEDLNTEEDMSQKRTKSKTNIEDRITDDVCQKRTRNKTSLEELVIDTSFQNVSPKKTRSKQRINGIKEDLISATVIESNSLKGLKNKVVEKDSPKTSDEIDLEDIPLQSRIECIFKKKSKSKISIERNNDNNKSTNVITEAEIEYSRLTRSKRSIDRRLSRSDSEIMSIGDISSRLTRSKSSLSMTIEVDGNTEDSFSKISERKRSITKGDTSDLEIENDKEDTINLQGNIDSNSSEIQVNLKNKLDKDGAKISNKEKNDKKEKVLASRIKRSRSLDKRTNKNDSNNFNDDNINSSRKNSLTNVKTQNVANKTNELVDDDSFNNKNILNEEKELEEILDTNMVKENDTSVRNESIENSSGSAKNLDTKGNNLNKKNLFPTKLDILEKTIVVNKLEEKLDKDEAESNSDNIKIISSDTEENDAREKYNKREKTMPSRIERSRSLSKRTNKNDSNNIINYNIDSSSILLRKNSVKSQNKDILDEERELEEILRTSIKSIQHSASTEKKYDNKNAPSRIANKDRLDKIKKYTDDIDSLQSSTRRSSLSDDEPFNLELRDSPCLETEAISNDDVQEGNSTSSVERKSLTTIVENLDNLVTSKKRTYRTRSHNKDFAENNYTNIYGSKIDASENIEETNLIKECKNSITKTNDENATITNETIVHQIQSTEHTVADASMDNLITSKKRTYRTRSHNKDFAENRNVEVEEENPFGSKTDLSVKEHSESIEETALIEERNNSIINDEDAVMEDQIQTSLIKPEINDSVEDTILKARRSHRRIDSKSVLEDCKETESKIDDNVIKIGSILDEKSEVIATDVDIKRARRRPRSKSVAPAYRYSENRDDLQNSTNRRSDETRTNYQDRRRSNSVGPRNNILKKMLNDYKKYAIPNIAKPKLGEIGWAQIGNYPYWPCVITNEPTSKIFTKSVLKKYSPIVFYHVRFFGDRGRRAWINRKKIMKFTDRNDLKRILDSLKEFKPSSELHAFIVRKPFMSKWITAVEEVEHVKSQKFNLKQIIKFMETVSVQSQEAQEEEQSETNVSTKSKETQKRKIKDQDDSTISEPPEKDSSTEDVHAKKKIKLSIKSSPSTSQKEKSPKKKISKAVEDEQPAEPAVNEDPIVLEPVKIEEVVIKDEISDIEYKVSIDSIQHFGYYSLDDQRSLYKRNNLFKGVPKDKVCQFCFNFGDLYRCKGGCQGTYHLKCSVQVLIEKVPKRRKLISPKIETSPSEGKKVEKLENNSGNQSEVDENHVQIITVPSSVCATPPGKTFPPDVMNMTLAERIDFKMKEIMKKFESKAYLEMLNESTSDEKPIKSPASRSKSFSMCQDLFSVGNQKSAKRSIIFNKELDAMAKINQRSPISAKQIEESLEMILKPPSTKHVTADSPGESTKSSGQAIKEEDDQRHDHMVANTEYSNSESIAKDKSKKPNRTRKSLMKHVTADFPSPPDKTGVGTSIPLEVKKPNGARKSLLKHVTADADSIETIDSESLRSTSSRQSKQSEISEQVELAYKNINPNPKHFKCGFCVEDIDPYCFICHDSVSRSGSNIRQKCSLYQCSRFYHPECLKLWPQTQWSLIQTTKNRFSQEEVDSFVCPQHVCHTCASDDPRAAISRCSGDKIVKCLSCPASYHSTNLCVPAGADIITSTQIVCPRHRNKNGKNLTINTTWCFICNEGGNLICCEICPTSVHPECMTVNLTDDDKFICEDCESGRLPLYDEIVWVKVGHFKWWPGLILFPNEVPPNVFNAKHTPGEFVVKFFGTYDHFWVNRGRSFLFQEGDTIDTGSNMKNKVETIFKKAVEEAVVAHKMKKQFKSTQAAETASSLKPPPYIKIKVSKPVGNVKLMELNLSNTTACECDPAQPNPCGPDSNCLNRLLWTECNPEVCPAGELCNNQSFEKREYPLLVPYKTEARGWGLKTLESIKKGTFVIEYVGELIDDEEYQRRVTKMHAQKEENYYFLTIHTNRMIDAGPKGNVARFMNHCCQPNCETQKWTVNGETRVGLFATEDIAADAELTFNYNLECTGTEKKVCKCGAPNCSGFIGVKAKQESTEPKKPKKFKKKEPVKVIVLPPCFICQKKGNVGLCNNKICNKAYHLRCLKLDEWPEGKKYVCPWHYCNVCSKRTIRCCVKCLNSFCPSHSEGNVRYDNLMGFVCNIHEPAKRNTISSMRKKRSTVTSEEAVVTSTTNDVEDDDGPLVFKRKNKKSKKISSGDSSNVDTVIDGNSISIGQSETESQDETVSSATASDFEDELQPKRKRKARRKMRYNRIRIKKRRRNVHQMNTANSNNDSLYSSSNSR